MSRVKAPWAWSQGYTGQGIVVAGQDTGYAWDHPALINAYRGYNAATGPPTTTTTGTTASTATSAQSRRHESLRLRQPCPVR